MKTTSLALLAATAIAASAIQPAAAARSHTYTVTIDGFCNVETVTVQAGLKGNSIIETGDSCDENFGTGLYTKIKGNGSFANFSWNSANSPGVTMDLVFSQPFTDGGQVTIRYTQDGVNQSVVGPYTYHLPAPGASMPSKTGLKPITSMIPHK